MQAGESAGSIAGEMRLDRRHRLLLAGDPRLVGSDVEADAGTLHAVRHGGGEAHILIAGNDVDAVLPALAMQLGTQRLPDAMRDDGVVEGVGELRRGQHRRRPVGDLLGLVERLVEHHGGQRGERDAATPAALVALRRARSPHRREQQDGIVENEVDARLLQPARLEAGVVDDDATATEEIGQYNQRARRNGTVEDHHGGALTVGELHGAQTVAGRRQPGRFHVEGEESVARKSRLRDRPAWRGEARRGRAHPSNFFPILLQSKNSLRHPLQKFHFERR